jgi:membrane-associated phospholipid phosphatase
MHVELPVIPTTIPTMNTPPASPHPPNTKLQWKQVLVSQDWASIFVNTFIVVGLIVTSQLNDTADRTFFTYDATIANEYHPKSTIPFWLAIVVPLLCMLLSLAIYEFVAYRRNINFFSLTSVLASVLHFFLDFCFAAVVTSLLTEVSKLLVGRFRPDWLSRCQPVTNSTVIPSWGISPSDNPECTNVEIPQSKLEDGRKSFPSGHASNAFAMGVYISGYVMYCTYFRAARKYYSRKKEGTWLQRVVEEMGTALSFLWILCNLSWAWYVLFI